MYNAARWVPVWFCVDTYVGTVKLIDGRSMQPTFNTRGREYNDLVVLDRWSARQLDLRRGDVVVLRAPNHPEELMTKRVVGLPGDCVQPRADARMGPAPTYVPRGHVWVEGDNSQASNDSNNFGAVAAALIEARVSYKIWPLEERGRVEQRELSRDRLIRRAPCETTAAAAAQAAGMLPWNVPSRYS